MAKWANDNPIMLFVAFVAAYCLIVVLRAQLATTLSACGHSARRVGMNEWERFGRIVAGLGIMALSVWIFWAFVTIINDESPAHVVAFIVSATTASVILIVGTVAGAILARTGVDL